MPDDESPESGTAATATTEATGGANIGLEQSYLLIGAYSMFFLSKLFWSYMQRLRD